MAKLGLNYHSITPPALAFIQRDRKSATTLLNDYDDTLEWVKEQLFVMHQNEPQSKEEQGYLPVQVVGKYYFVGVSNIMIDLFPQSYSVCTILT